MIREDALMMMHPRLYDLLGKMFAHFRGWGPCLGYPRTSAGFSTAGRVQEFADLEEEVESAAIAVLEAGWDELGLAEKTAIEMCIGRMPWVWTVREGVMETAIAKLEKRMKMIGAL